MTDRPKQIHQTLKLVLRIIIYLDPPFILISPVDPDFGSEQGMHLLLIISVKDLQRNIRSFFRILGLCLLSSSQLNEPFRIPDTQSLLSDLFS